MTKNKLKIACHWCTNVLKQGTAERICKEDDDEIWSEEEEREIVKIDREEKDKIIEHNLLRSVMRIDTKRDKILKRWSWTVALETDVTIN